ncbi:cytochrome aa3-600 menaquinol oxidase subunit 4 [Fontibacillus solani]|uniref:Quinol oxidase subunit 4 n=1 Tax=Fontibacillus solani TaxID=1572857 RepID=A0A7W3SPB9_9BACL|nr:cytochrome aa3 quinol oxidase subunit IV [Fontibacillus solani]MBA9083619.1 cytochrome aa3-600 menaquinol oxidase subunit 4 [Fontibacillus solani]
MKKLFPTHHVMGYVFSLILSVVALAVVFWDLSLAVGMTILVIAAVIQMSLQLFLFMHIGENGSKTALYTNIVYALFVGLVTVFGTLFTMIWGYQ